MTFTFNKNNLSKAGEILLKYPKKNQYSAILPILHIAQEQNNGWISKDVMMYIGDFLDMPYIKVYEIASFYTMFNLKPVGKYHIQLCRTTPCWLCNSDEIKKTFEEEIKIKCGESSKDRIFSLSEVECLGACINAPIVQINDKYYEKLNKEIVKKLVKMMYSNEL